MERSSACRTVTGRLPPATALFVRRHAVSRVAPPCFCPPRRARRHPRQQPRRRWPRPRHHRLVWDGGASCQAPPLLGRQGGQLDPGQRVDHGMSCSIRRTKIPWRLPPPVRGGRSTRRRRRPPSGPPPTRPRRAVPRWGLQSGDDLGDPVDRRHRGVEQHVAASPGDHCRKRGAHGDPGPLPAACRRSSHQDRLAGEESPHHTQSVDQESAPVDTRSTMASATEAGATSTEPRNGMMAAPPPCPRSNGR